MNTFAKHQAHISAYDDAMFLGQLCWWSVPEVLIDHTALVQKMQAAGLDALGLPPVPRTADVFRRACTKAKRNRVASPTPGQFHNYLVREVGTDDDTIFRQIVRETVDSNGHRLEYVSLVELQFARNKGIITQHKWVQDANGMDKNAVQMVEEIQEYFKRHNNTLSAFSLRNLIRTILQRLQATQVRPGGGVYFVQQDHAGVLGKLETLINELDECSFHVLPLLDDMKQREMLKKSFEDESIEEIDRILGDISEITRTKQKISAEKYSAIAAEYTRLTKKGQQYSHLLDDAMTETSSRLTIFQEAIVNLMDYVK